MLGDDEGLDDGLLEGEEVDGNAVGCEVVGSEDGTDDGLLEG